MRFSMKSMLAAFAVIAVCIVGLNYANLAWAAFFYSTAFLLVLTGIVGSLVRSWPARAYWIGIAIFGGGYFWLALMEEGNPHVSTQGVIYSEPSLATTHLLIWVDRFFWPERPGIAGGRSAAYRTTRMASDYFVQVGHGIFTLLLALVGGKLGMSFAKLGRPSGVD